MILKSKFPYFEQIYFFSKTGEILISIDSNDFFELGIQFFYGKYQNKIQVDQLQGTRNCLLEAIRAG